ncbi:hypothetical protein PLESTB_000711000 [Pleodorina starrii]|uniref:Uncharacterized protein n=1 Tax=Pleodorina starrii TaxID=330485 RepID=A0A9W6B9Q4_9CHLO|nr:hypothetical protein PLESTM_000782100 [Pleodorina starrii]GLC48064.1 hypothetical protein PLESTB_000055200 [Pleodorina starrii]GLC53127.1 hypothetical protein PLESTB_000711000 [Pleodorina starrii]GLC68067.1 hypothetical protein PLESTF_000642500 [Pleodorina starrii]
MPPKKDGKKKGGGKKKKGAKPAWMSDGLWELSQNLQKLSEFYSGDIKETKLKEGQAPPPNITRTQAGMFIWQLLFPSNKAAKAKRDEAVKYGVVETSVKILASGKAPDMTPALGILVAMTSDNPVQRQVMMDSKPAPLQHVLAALNDESASLRAAACSLLRVVAREQDTRPRLWRLMRADWDWRPLVACLDLTDMSQLGGRSACYDAAAAMEALCCAPEVELANGACAALMAAGGPAHMVKVLRTRHAHPMAKAASVAVLNQLLRRASPAACEEVVVGLSALEPLAVVFLHPVIPLVYKAHSAACMLRYVMPDSLWRATAAAAKAAAAGPPPASAGSEPAAGDAAAANGAAPPAEGAPAAPAAGAPGAPAAAAAAAPAAGAAAPPAPPVGGAASSGGAAATAVATVTRGLEAGLGLGPDGLGPGGMGGIEVPNVDLLDDETREQVVGRARKVAALDGVLRSLVGLCVGPDGPLPDLEAVQEGQPPAEEPKGKKKKKKSKKKKAKMEPGTLEAQTYASAVLRLVSLAEEQRPALVEAAAIRYLLPLLEGKNSAARWNARQTLINLSMSPDLLPKLQLYKVPDYVHQANVPQSHFERPLQQSTAGLLQAQDSVGRKAVAAPQGLAAVVAKMKPPALKAKPT